jgi:hypothetical protein
VLVDLVGRHVLAAVVASPSDVGPGGAFEIRSQFSRLAALG